MIPGAAFGIAGVRLESSVCAGALANSDGKVPEHLLSAHGRAIQRFLDQLA
jgi:hypothetical protein